MSYHGRYLEAEEHAEIIWCSECGSKHSIDVEGNIYCPKCGKKDI